MVRMDPDTVSEMLALREVANEEDKAKLDEYFALNKSNTLEIDGICFSAGQKYEFKGETMFLVILVCPKGKETCVQGGEPTVFTRDMMYFQVEDGTVRGYDNRGIHKILKQGKLVAL